MNQMNQTPVLNGCLFYNFNRTQEEAISQRLETTMRKKTSNQVNKLVALTGLFFVPVVAGADTAAVADWHAKTLGEAILHTAVFAIAGIVLAIIGYKLFDLATPGKLHAEIFENKNLAAGLIGAAIILGVCILVAAAMLG